MQDFTEDEAKDQLEKLGFEVVRADSQEFLGWAIEPRLGGWGVDELYRTKGTFDRIGRSLSPRLDTIEQCLDWIDAYGLKVPSPPNPHYCEGCERDVSDGVVLVVGEIQPGATEPIEWCTDCIKVMPPNEIKYYFSRPPIFKVQN